MQYQRHIDIESDDSLAKLLRRIPLGSEVLELGPATGYCTRYLSETLGCIVDAIEISEGMAKHARPWCRQLILGDLETIDLEKSLGTRQYQVILCADVLEHLRDPWALAKSLSNYLTPDGRLLLSIPNVGYLGLLIDLLRGNFRYRAEGLLDRTHLRFFTFESINELLEQTGWHVWAAEQVTISLTDSEFRVRLESVLPALRDELLARPDAMCYQWVLEARRSTPPSPILLQRIPSEDHFQVRLFWRNLVHDFVETENSLAWGGLGREAQRLELRIPPGTEALALRLTDRISFIRVKEICLLAEDNALVWRWAPEDGPLAIRSAQGVQPADTCGHWFATHTDSRLEFEILPSLCAQARKMELVLDSPMSADFIAAIHYWTNPNQLPANLTKQLACTNADNWRLEQALNETSNSRMALAHQVELKQLENSELMNRLSSLNEILGTNEAERKQSARLIRFCKKIPGLVKAVDRLAVARKQWLTWFQ